MAMNSGVTVFLFGPQALSFGDNSLKALRETLLESPNSRWALETIAELPGHWDTLVKGFPSLQHIPGEQLLRNLNSWFETGDVNHSSSQLPNIVLTPLVVLTQLTQYSRYLQLSLSDTEDVEDLQAAHSRRKVETVGFCTGLLSAMAVSSSSDKATFRQYGAVAVRLAMLIGALVDAQDASGRLHGKSKSFATAWRSQSMANEMSTILDRFPEAYISVIYDAERATLTTAEGTAPLLLQQLKQSGVTVSEVGLRGRFHCQCHHEDLDSVIEFCDSNPAFQFPDLSKVISPIHLGPGTQESSTTRLHHRALRMILEEQSRWYETFSALQAARLQSKESVVVSFGPDRAVPPSLMRKLGPRLVHAADLDLSAPQLSGSVLDPTAALSRRSSSDDDIAVISMSCQVAGASDLQEFWDILCKGESQHIEVPEERFGFETQWRELDIKRKWYGNFIKDHDVFDHKFFKRSPREMASTDPQQRLMLQAAYQAVEQSGYFTQPNVDKRIGCYVGACAADYEANVAGQPANAFTATGNLKSFITGKISHYFGWTGPGLTIDTACSASAVAIHQACRAILGGECSGALAGGVGIMGHPIWFQNLAGASFLSPTGQCKPYDDKADGYCRGEAVALVMLKKMSTAVADGNQILGCIPSTAVYQNENCTPIVVPNAPSLSGLFKDVLYKARLEPQQISVVEAHGTGTPVGDPAEYESVRQALGGPDRKAPLSLGSVKGLVGHTEGASGVVSLIKTILMIQEGTIPPQASFQNMSHHIKASPSDMIEISKELKPWKDVFKAALINNYGASGSNASMVVTQPFQKGQDSIDISSPIHAPATKHPFRICGLDHRSVQDYCTKLLSLIKSPTFLAKNVSTATLSFNVCRQSNPSLENGLAFSCSSVIEVENKLTAFVAGDRSTPLAPTPKTPRPVIMCFGGQISTFIGLHRAVYDSVKIFRSYLDQCNSVFLSIGINGIYPEIFQREPITDTIKLQTALFAIQYACAKSWIDCNVPVTAVVGHSFGELTALCVSGVLSLKDTAKMIASRARLVRDSWEQDKGAMMAVEADLEVVQKILAEAEQADDENEAATIACFNGPRSFTLAGSVEAIDIVADIIAKNDRYSSSTRTKKLNVTNAFHSTLVEPLMTDLERIGHDLTFHEAKIPLERSTELPYTEEMQPAYVAEHMRYPVYFNHAVQRLARQYPSALWLEAGSNSTITTMASRALGAPSSFYFQSVNITNKNGLQSLAETAVTLWTEGLRNVHWWHHALQTYDYPHIFLPPYQFEKSRHWIELKKPQKLSAELEVPQVTASEEELPKTLWTFVGWKDKNQRSARFRVNTFTQKYESFVSGHMIAQTAPICPATLEVDMAIEALMSVRPDFATAGLQPTLRNMENHAPICVDPSRLVWLDFEALDADCHSWSWKIVSENPAKTASTTEHVRGKLVFRSVDDPEFQLEFARYERLIGHHRCLKVLNADDADDIIQGRNIYRTFAEIVDYGEQYQGLKRLVGLGNECAGQVLKEYTGETWLDTHLTDCFSQVAGIFVNCMTNRASGDMFIASGCESLIRSPKLRNDSPRPKKWNVYAYHHQTSDKAYTTDVFTFDATTGALLEIMLGINYAKVPKASMQKMLTRLTPGLSNKQAHASPPVPISPTTQAEKTTPLASATAGPVKAADTSKPKKQEARPNLKSSVKTLLSNVSGLEPEDIKDDTELTDIGIDSLMGMELAKEVETVFKCTLDMDKLMEVTDLPSFVDCIQSALGEVQGGAEADGSDTDELDTPGSGTTPSLNSSPPSSVSSDAEEEPTSKIVKAAPTSPVGVDMTTSRSGDKLNIPDSAVMEAFGEAKLRTDELIIDYKIDNFAETICPKSTQLCIALTLEAIESLGCPIKTAKANQVLPRIPHAPQHGRLVEYLYELLEKEARVIDIDGSKITRTAISLPKKSSNALLQDLLRVYPDWSNAMKLTHFAGLRLADVLTGKADGIKVIFGSEEGRELVSGLYCEHVFNKMSYHQMADFIERLVSRLDSSKGPLKILEMGAGTGGTTLRMAPLLARLNVPVEYTFTDLSGSMVGQARKNYKQYPFMRFFAHDIEKPVSAELQGTQHIVIASNAVHATHDLVKSAANIRAALRPDGVLMMLEMTEIVPFVDIIFGLLEGWWLFDDGRKHAIAHQDRWERDLHAAGFGHVDWSDGHLPENHIQKVIIAMASPSSTNYPRLPLPSPPAPMIDNAENITSREKAVATYANKFSSGFIDPTTSVESATTSFSEKRCVLVTGATGSLGTHLVKELAEHADVTSVVCLNRRSSSNADPTARQRDALTSRGVTLDVNALAKLHVIETDMHRAKLGLSDTEYATIVHKVTDILHNAWPMSGKRPIKGFEPQFQALRNLINLARDISSARPQGFQVGFEFISSIGVVGHYPLWSGSIRVPEEQMEMRSVLDNGYCDAKFTCERILDATLHKYPDKFRTLTARLGQIAGSKTSGYWNPMEHFSFLIKSSKSLRVLPGLEGNLSWCPVNDMAGALSELLLDNPTPYPVYHIDNPVQQPWRKMIQTLADALGIPRDTGIIPFTEWVSKVRKSPMSVETDNPAGRLIDFLDDNFLRMSCGGLVMDVSKACEHSPTLAAVGPVSADVARKYIRAWEDMGFL